MLSIHWTVKYDDRIDKFIENYPENPCKNVYGENKIIMSNVSIASLITQRTYEELEKEYKNLQLDYQDRIDDIEDLQDQLQERELMLLNLKADNAKLKYDFFLSETMRNN